MLHLSYLGEAAKLDISEEALKLLIVRVPPEKIPNGFIHVPQLSPSPHLFKTVRRWKGEDFTINETAWLGENNLIKKYEGKDLWWFLYKRKFNEELKQRPDMKKALERLILLLNQNKEVYLFCYCKDVDRCHRGLVGGYVEDKGYKVDFRYNTQMRLF